MRWGEICIEKREGCVENRERGRKGKGEVRVNKVWRNKLGVHFRDRKLNA